MPKRSTLNYSSDNAPPLPDQDRLYVYYCKFSGKHVLTTDADLQRAPRRRTDSSRVVDCKKHSVRLYTTAAEQPVALQRPDGHLEKQWRQFSTGKLPVAYRSDPDSDLLYVLDGACTTFSLQDREAGVPVPPCIRNAGGDTVEVLLEIADRGNSMKVTRLTADVCKVQTTKSIAAVRSGVLQHLSNELTCSYSYEVQEDANEQLLEFMRGLLGIPFSAVTLLRGSSVKRKRLLVSGLSPVAVYTKLQAAL